MDHRIYEHVDKEKNLDVVEEINGKESDFLRQLGTWVQISSGIYLRSNSLSQTSSIRYASSGDVIDEVHI